MAYAQRLPSARPPGLQLSSFRSPWYRLDGTAPSAWTWTPYPRPRSRFDSASGHVRVRYAGAEPRVALRERFDAKNRLIEPGDLELRFVELRGAIRVLDLRLDRTLDALRLDDQISTSRARDVWAVAQQLVDLIHEWFGERCHGLVYRSRTTPERAANLAFFEHAPLVAHDLGTLREQAILLESCVLSDGFEIQGWR